MYTPHNSAEGPTGGDSAFEKGPFGGRFKEHFKGHRGHHGHGRSEGRGWGEGRGDAQGWGQAAAEAHGWGPHAHAWAHPRHAGHRAPVSIYKTADAYEMLVFAPGRVKENFKVKLSDGQLVVSYQPTEDTSALNWVVREYSRGGFERSFQVGSTVDKDAIQARYEDGVLKLTLPIKPGSEPQPQDVPVN
jgi:HSP20 family protein